MNTPHFSSIYFIHIYTTNIGNIGVGHRMKAVFISVP